MVKYTLDQQMMRVFFNEIYLCNLSQCLYTWWVSNMKNREKMAYWGIQIEGTRSKTFNMNDLYLTRASHTYMKNQTSVRIIHIYILFLEKIFFVYFNLQHNFKFQRDLTDISVLNSLPRSYIIRFISLFSSS